MLVTQSCLIAWGSLDHSPLGFSLHGISQARILEWAAIPFSRGSSHPRYWTRVFCTAGRFFTIWARGSPLGDQGSPWKPGYQGSRATPGSQGSPFIALLPIYSSRLPWWHGDKEPTCQGRRHRDAGLIPGLGSSPGVGNGYPSSILTWEIQWTERRLVDDSPCGCTWLSTTRLSSEFCFNNSTEIALVKITNNFCFIIPSGYFSAFSPIEHI